MLVLDVGVLPGEGVSVLEASMVAGEVEGGKVRLALEPSHKDTWHDWLVHCSCLFPDQVSL